MSGRGAKKITTYVEAQRELTALDAQLRALADDPAAKARWLARWGRDLAETRTRTKLAYAALTGGELARARARLAAPATSEEETP